MDRPPLFDVLASRCPDVKLAGAILVGVNDSIASSRAVEHAVELARLFGAPLLTVHIVNVRAAFRPGIHYRTALQKLSAEGSQALAQAARTARSRGVATIPLQVYGSPADALVQVAIAASPRLVVLPKQSPSLFEALLRRSLAEQMLRNIKCPLYLVGAADAAPIYWHNADPSLIATANLHQV